MNVTTYRETSAGQQLVSWLWSRRGASPRLEDIATVKMLLLDHLVVTARGSQTTAARAFRRYIASLGAPAGGDHVLLGVKERSSPAYAAMANAIAANTLELDDTHNASATHPGSVIFPAAFAAAMTTQADGQTLIAGVLNGYEVMCRLGRALDGAELHRRHVLPTGICGHLGAVTACATIFDLSGDDALSALGIAAALAAGSLQFLEDGAWTKQLAAAYAARNGYEAALLAQAGYEGPRDGISGVRGLLASYDANACASELVAELGARPLEVHATSIKMHACCLYMHSAIDAIIRLRRERRFEPKRIRSITIGLFTEALHVVWTPRTSRQPQTVEEAQFSMSFAAAVAALDGTAGLAQFSADRLADAATHKMMERVSCVADPVLDKQYPGKKSAWVEIRDTDGNVHRVDVDAARGDPTNPASVEEHMQKLHAVIGGSSATCATVDEMRRYVGHLDELPRAYNTLEAVAAGA